MDEAEKEMLKQFGDGNRFACLVRLVEQLQNEQDLDRQGLIMNMVTRVCSFETDDMFKAYAEELRTD